jgi:hypothetical protein
MRSPCSRRPIICSCPQFGYWILDSDHICLDACRLVIPVDIAKHITLVKLIVSAKAMIGYDPYRRTSLFFLLSIRWRHATSAGGSGYMASLGRR